jgi:outer membrane immunogenic protein
MCDSDTLASEVQIRGETMNPLRRLALIGLTLGFITNGAIAADLDLTEPAAPLADWSGFYAGLHAGWGWADLDYAIEEDSDFWQTPQFEVFSIDADGPVAGAQAGFNWQIDSFLLGLEADISWSGIDGDFRAVDLPDNGYFFNDDTEIDWLASVRARVGLLWDQVLFYATGGIAFTSVDTKVVSDWSGDIEKYSDSTSHTGWVAGGGLEVMVTNNITGRLEFLHYDFNDDDFFVDGGYDLEGDLDFDVNVVRAGVNVLF